MTAGVRVWLVALPLCVGALAAGTGAAFAQAADAPCDVSARPGVWREVKAEGVTLIYAPTPAPIPLDRHFEIDVRLCGADATALRVDAEMPLHRHGMNYRATVRRAGPGHFVATGLLFHMPGRWRVVFDVDVAGRTQRLADEVDVE